MKITITNLGVLKKAEIDLKPLTILVGKNNTGKTWMAYALAGALGNYGWRRYVAAYAAGKTQEKYQELNILIKQITEIGEGVLDLVQFADKHGEKCINGMLTFTKTWMRDFLGTDHVKFDMLEMRAAVAEIKEDLLKRLQDISIENSLGQHEESAPLRALKEPGESKLFFYPGQNITERLPTRAIREFVAATVFREILRFLYPYIYIFPTERATIINERFQPISRSLLEEGPISQELQDFLEKLAHAAPKSNHQSWPLGSFTGMMINLYENGSIVRRKEDALEEPAILQYIQLADILQGDILEGNLDFSTSDPNPTVGREILFKPSCLETTELEVSISSSMVKELSSLVLYLRYLAQSGELLVIDEPEMNLHPAAQVKIIEFLAMLVNAGLHVLVTTHSTYVVDHLMNLMDAYKHQNQDDIVGMFLLESKDAFITQEKVSVYQIEDGETKSILDSEGRIHWQTFSDVTRLVERIHFEL